MDKFDFLPSGLASIFGWRISVTMWPPSFEARNASISKWTTHLASLATKALSSGPAKVVMARKAAVSAIAVFWRQNAGFSIELVLIFTGFYAWLRRNVSVNCQLNASLRFISYV